MKISTLSISRPVLASMMSLALVIFGIIGLGRLPVRELPDIDPPIINVQTIYPGASASVIETQVTEPLEDVLMSVEGIRTITSESREQVSSITIEFNLSREIDVVAQDVRDRVARVRGKLPDDIDDPIVAKQEADASPVLWIALYSDRYSTLELSQLAEDLFKDRLQTINGVSSVIFGGQKRFAIRLWLDSKKMAARGVTVLDIQAALKRENVELPSGTIENAERSLSIETRGQMKKPEEYNRMVIRRDGDTVIRFGDVGQAMVGVEDEHSIARFNSKPAVGIGVIKQSKANTIEVVNNVKKEVAKIAPTLPQGIVTSFPYDESVYVQKAIVEVWETLAIAFILVVLTIYVFLYNFRSTFVPAISIPVCIIATFGALYGLGYSINVVTMLGLVLAIGLVVDDSIIVLENIYRHIEAGMKPFDAAIKGMSEIGFVVIATTIALVCVFLPMAFQTSVTGRLFIEFAVAICFSVLISAFVALTLTPMLSAKILKPIAHDHQHTGILAKFEESFARITARYKRALTWSLAHAWVIALTALAALGLTVFFYTRLDHEFVPLEDKGRFLVFAIAPVGSTVEYTDRIVKQMEGIVSTLPEKQEYFSAVALARGGPGNPAQGLAFVRLKEDRKRHLRDIVGGPKGVGGQFFMQIPGAFVVPIMPKSFGGGFTQPFELVVQGQDLTELNDYAQKLVGKLRSSGYLMNVRSNFELNKPELRVSINRERAAQLGVSIEDIAKTLQVAFGGLDLSKVNINGKQYDVDAQLTRAQRFIPSDLDILFVRNAKGEQVQLSNLITYDTGAGPSAINHYNRMRSAVIEGTPTGVTLGTAMDRTVKLLKDDLPPGFRYEWKGEAKDLIESSNGIYFVMILALIVIYMVLAAQFEHLIHPLTVMMTLPLAAFGAFGGLWMVSLFKVPSMGVNLYSQIGMILLFGLVTKNAILLVDFANQEIAKGKNAADAMVAAGVIRLRPILMTACATIAGILPIAIGFGASGEARRPMGVAAVGGMLTATFLTLFVIPIVYVWFSKMFSRGQVKKTAAAIVMVIVAFGLQGCSVGKNYQRPNLDLPISWKEKSAITGTHVPVMWWTSFNNAQLNALEDQAVANNQDLRMAITNVDKARALARVERASFLPDLDVNAQMTKQQFSRNANKALTKIRQNKYDVPLDFSYELDLFGKVRRAYEASVDEVHASEAAYQNVLLTLTADVAQNFFLLRQMDQEIEVLKEEVLLRQKIQEILKSREEAGITAHLDVSAASTELARAQAQILETQRKRALYEHALSVLCGQAASNFSIAPTVNDTVIIPVLPGGFPSDLLKRRWDIIEAEYVLSAANAKVGVAKGEFFPSISLTGSTGYSSLSADDIFTSSSWAYSLGPQVKLPLFHGGANRANLEARKAEFDHATASYKQTILQAFKDVEDALLNVRLRQDQNEAYTRLLEAADTTFKLSTERYKQGLVSYLEVVDSRRSHLEARLSLTEIQTDQMIATVLLIKALGGGWEK